MSTRGRNSQINFSTRFFINFPNESLNSLTKHLVPNSSIEFRCNFPDLSLKFPSLCRFDHFSSAASLVSGYLVDEKNYHARWPRNSSSEVRVAFGSTNLQADPTTRLLWVKNSGDEEARNRLICQSSVWVKIFEIALDDNGLEFSLRRRFCFEWKSA